MITLNNLFTLPELEPIHLVAGNEGINRPISGVNVMESDSLAEFFKENELLVTTGINIQMDEQKLIAMVQMAFHRKTAGIILNVGPYIPYIPEQVIAFANEHRFPVFEMPWVYRVADFVKITVQYLAATEQKETKSRHALSELLFQPEPDADYVSKAFTQLGIKTDHDFAIIVCACDSKQTISSSLRYVAEDELSRKYKLLLSMHGNAQMIYLVSRSEFNDSTLPLKKIIETIYQKCEEKFGKTHLSIGMGNEYPLKTLTKSYHEAMTVIRLHQRHPELSIYEYKKIGAYKIIMDVRERNVIESFHQESLGLLYRYDQLHETDFVHFLRVFLEEDGRTANIARKEFIHRNTVLYKMKKIESILGTDLCQPFAKTNLSLAFMIEDLMD
ncbi:PucR family transcriptional regulator [Sporolactobacillus laevolacticus]|uniref:PucR family transcriptional regulator n=1 Tax=Sporolactobacillus laevolacticus TaxID=33018 RepID=UPI0025B29BF5|nr:PucR family transcriptional regulator [Sporolactobacillus laevolacticus]MDN3954883.1 PucR family transcriptional regulator ligand-binding domain-containing protein [Sporolactobacillus laevolacticus]